MSASEYEPIEATESDQLLRDAKYARAVAEAEVIESQQFAYNAYHVPPPRYYYGAWRPPVVRDGVLQPVIIDEQTLPFCWCMFFCVMFLIAIWIMVLITWDYYYADDDADDASRRRLFQEFANMYFSRMEK